MKKGMMISCEDATELVVKKSHESLKFWDRFRLMFHLAMCRFCSLFEKQNKIIDAMAAQMDETIPEKMPEATKQKILQEIGE